MRRNARCPRAKVLIPRRGNSIVLVMGILVLLVIIATAFITRTQAGRVTSSVMVRSTLRDDNARATAEMLAQLLGEALFPRPVNDDPVTGDPDVLNDLVADSNYPRLSPIRNPFRYGVDQDVDNDGFPDYPYNFAPYHVVPYTNLPDPLLLDAPNWPSGPGNLHPGAGIASPFLAFEGNPIGNPGFGDTRWLADHEPLRWDTNGDGILDAFSHWRHMTNIAHANNGFRIVFGIQDVGDNEVDPFGLGRLIMDLSVPAEQWLAVLPEVTPGVPMFNAISGNAFLVDEADFFGRWGDWFFEYANTYWDPALVPPNFYDLSDLDGDGDPFDHPDGDSPQDEFVAGSARHAVSSILADTDGDGFTDSFWYLAPTMTERGIRQIVAVRIVDNSAMLNANVATRFLRNDTDFIALGPQKTRGQTPADLALVGQNAGGLGADNWNVGIYDSPLNAVQDLYFDPGGTDYVVEYLSARWDDHVDEVGLGGGVGNPNPTPTAQQRLDYWRRSGLDPLSPALGVPNYTPFAPTDELELRMYHGNNYPWIYSRYEYSVQPVNCPGVFCNCPPDHNCAQFLRASTAREESSEYLNQLNNVQLLRDNRRKLTLFSGARNDQMPPWLWLFASPNADNNNDGFVNEIDFNLWLAGTRKFDLRLPPIDLDNDGITEEDVDGDGDVELDPDDVKLLGENLRRRLLRALIDDADESYYGDAVNLGDTQMLAASLAANILAYRDLHDLNGDAPLTDAVALYPEIGPPFHRYLGMERQPFLLEAFIGHVYKAVEVPDADPLNIPYSNSGNYVILEDPTLRSTVVAVQLANPFDEPIDLSLYEVSVFGQVVDLGPLGLNLGQLPAATDDNPRTLVLYVLENDLMGDALQTKWLDFMDLSGIGDLPSGSIVREVGSWSTDRGDYDTSNADAIVIRRRNSVPPNEPVVIDRIDSPALADRLFGEEINDLLNNIPPDKPVIPPLAAAGPYPGIDLGPALAGFDHWVQWGRVTRAWGYDIDGDVFYDPNERNPRYVFGKRAVVKPTAGTTPDGSFIAGGNKYKFGDNPDTPNPWFARNYKNVDGFTVSRKPTFFDMYHNNDPANPSWSYPNKGWYGQGEPGSVDVPPNGPGNPGDLKLDFPMQMLQKDRDFDQVGELLNVWLYGHELEFDISGAYVGTTETFSEFMIDQDLVGRGERVNRLRVEPKTILGDTFSAVIGVGDPDDLLDPLHSVPALPAGARVLDAFVCDDRGVNAGGSRFGNANGYSGKITPGLININTAGVPVLRSAPHMARLVHELDSPSGNPYVRVPEAITRYRERFGNPSNAMDSLPAYGDRGGTGFLGNAGLDDLRGDRGFASLGELMLLLRSASTPGLNSLEPNENWRIDFAGKVPYVVGGSTRISTDVNDLAGNDPDLVAEDSEELNLLFAGMSNILTTRSDVFTVYFRVRSFIQNPTTQVWDATNPEFIVDDSRYVMLVDRSEVNHPNDKPKILYLEKLPK